MILARRRTLSAPRPPLSANDSVFVDLDWADSFIPGQVSGFDGVGGLSDQASAIVARVRAASDTMTATDSAAGGSLTGASSDTLAVSDAAATPASLSRSASDTTTASDSATAARPAAVVQKVGEAFTDITNTASLSFAPAATTTGNTLFAFIKFGGGAFMSSVTDTKGNTWVIDGEFGAAGPTVTVFRCSNHTGLTAGDTITFTAPGGQGDWGGVVLEVSGLTTAGADKSASATGSGVNTLTANQGTATAAAGLAFAMFGEGGSPPSGSTYTPSTGWTAVPTTNAARTLGLAYQTTAAASTQSVTWTASNSLNCVAAIETYR